MNLEESIQARGVTRGGAVRATDSRSEAKRHDESTCAADSGAEEGGGGQGHGGSAGAVGGRCDDDSGARRHGESTGAVDSDGEVAGGEKGHSGSACATDSGASDSDAWRHDGSTGAVNSGGGVPGGREDHGGPANLAEKDGDSTMERKANMGGIFVGKRARGEFVADADVVEGASVWKNVSPQNFATQVLIMRTLSVLSVSSDEMLSSQQRPLHEVSTMLVTGDSASLRRRRAPRRARRVLERRRVKLIPSH